MINWLNKRVPTHTILWTLVGAAYGAATSWLTLDCMCAIIPAMPGMFITEVITGDKVIVTDAGPADWLAYLPFTIVFYAMTGFIVGLLLDLRNKQKSKNPYVCTMCRYSLIGNTSGKCPECGTPISTATMRKIAALDSGQLHGATGDDRLDGSH